MSSSTRVFFGFALSEQDRLVVARVQRALGARLAEAGHRARARWVSPGDFHLTLRFIGVVPNLALPEHAGALARAFAGAARVPVYVERVLGFPSAHRARTLVLGLRDPGQQLAAMAQRLERELQPLGIEPEPRPLVPHVTLARVSPALDLARLSAVNGDHDTEIMLSRVCLFESRGGRAEQRYVPLSALELPALGRVR